MQQIGPPNINHSVMKPALSVCNRLSNGTFNGANFMPRNSMASSGDVNS